MQYEWPGNIRELENMIKRIVILQDEQLVVHEIERNIQRALAAAGAGGARVCRRGRGGWQRRRRKRRCRCRRFHTFRLPPSAPDVESADEADGTTEPAETGGGSLATVAKAAAMKAERAAIEHTLRQVHWNRRKAAQSLGVSYKTLLNKIKECGISRA